MAQENYKTFDFAPYESNFAKGRREELADRTRQEFDANKAEYDILQRSIGSLETTDTDKKYIDALNSDIEGGMQGVLETGRYDLASFAVSDSLTRFMTDNNVKNAVKTFEKIKEEDARMAANPNKYKKYYEVPAMLDENDVEWTAADYSDPNKQGIAELDANGNPVMKDLRQEHDSGILGAYVGNSEEAYDHTARASTMMKGIAKDSRFYPWVDAIAKKYGVDKEEAARMIMTGEGVTRNKVEGLAEALLDVYASTPEGLQRAKVLSLELSPQVEYYGKTPLMQLNSDEEIQNVLLNDLITAGQTQIGQTVDIRNIPNPAPPGPSDRGTDRPGDYIQSINPDEILTDLNASYKTNKNTIKSGKNKIYDANGMIKMQKIKIPGIRGRLVDGEEPDSQSLDKAYKRAVTSLEEQASNNPLDIADEYARTIYINTEFGGLKVDKNGNPLAVSDLEFAYQIEKSLINAKSIQNTVYTARKEASQKGSRSGNTQAAEYITDNLNHDGVLIYDSELNPNQGLTITQWDKLMDDNYWWHDEGTAEERLRLALSNTAKGTSKDPDSPDASIGLTLRPKSPGANEVSYIDEKGNKRTVYIKIGELSQKMLEPASGLIDIATNPLEPMVRALPDIFDTDLKLTQEQKDAGIRTFISNELRSTGGLDAAGNEIPFSVKPSYFVYKGIIEADGSVTKVSKHQYISQDKVNQFLHTAVKAYTLFGPDQATSMADTEPKT
tara:strand:+ start:219 stop:2396 length:2178 start_codon:yes stop_codon:yes gene_type:complete